MATTKPLAAHQIAALRYLAAHPHNPVYPSGVQAGTLALLRRRGLVGKHKPNRRTATTSPITDAGRALLATLDAPIPAIVARLEALGYADVRGVASVPGARLDAIEVRGRTYPLRAVGDNAPEATYRIIADLSGEDAVALAVRGVLPVFEVGFIATDDADADDRGRPVAVRFSRLWPAVSAERAREEAERWGAGDGCGEVTDVGETMPLTAAAVPHV